MINKIIYGVLGMTTFLFVLGAILLLVGMLTHVTVKETFEGETIKLFLAKYSEEGMFGSTYTELAFLDENDLSAFGASKVSISGAISAINKMTYDVELGKANLFTIHQFLNLSKPAWNSMTDLADLADVKISTNMFSLVNTAVAGFSLIIVGIVGVIVSGASKGAAKLNEQ